MKKLWNDFLAGLILAMCLFGTIGCKKEESAIPSGYYSCQTNGEYVYCEKEHKKFLFIEKVHK